MKKAIWIVVAALFLFVNGCVVAPPPPVVVKAPKYTKIWVPGHHTPRGVWVPGHWRRR